MKSITLTRETVLASTGFLLVLACSNIWLTARVRSQKRALDTFAGQQAAVLPSAGESLPVLSGRRLSTGEEYSLIPSASPPFAILVFRESCHFCEANWKNWEELFGKNDLRIPVVFISSDAKISDSYREKHPLLNGRHVMIGANPDDLSSLKLGLTPQTIYVVNGKVKRDWAGVLTDEDVKEIRSEVISLD